MHNRIKSIRKESGMSQDDFANSIGLKRGNYSMIELGKSMPSIETLKLIANNFGKSYEWIIEGKEPDKKMVSNLVPNMVSNPNNYAETKEEKHQFNEPEEVYNKIPLLTVDAIAGWASGDFAVQDTDIERYVVPEFKGVDFLIRVKGSSMYPKYSSGDIVACQYIKESRFIQWGKVYVLDSTQGALVKRLFKSEDKNCIECRSDNEAYPPFDVPKNEIRAMALVIGVIRLE